MKKLFQLLICSALLICVAGFVQASARAGLNNKIVAVQTRPLAPAQIVPGKMNFERSAVLLAQMNDPVRVNQLEEQVRQLNGQVEELNFQLLEMQEKLRKIQEDNEFRFQELEEKADASGDGKKRLGKSQPSETSKTAEGSGGVRPTITDMIGGSVLKQSKKRVIDGVEIFDPNSDVNADSIGAKIGGSLGTLTFDADGNMIDNNAGKPIQLVPGLRNSQAGLSLPGTANELFDLGYQYVQGAEYDRSAEAFRAFSNRYPGDARISEANFWLGESFLSLGRYEDAARVFFDNHKQFPNSRFGAQNLLKLGVSLAGLSQRELACATYAEVPNKYPDISRAIRNRVELEQTSAKCKG